MGMAEMIQESKDRWERGGNPARTVEVVLDRDELARDQRREWRVDLGRTISGMLLAALVTVSPLVSGWQLWIVGSVPLLVVVALSVEPLRREYDLLARHWAASTAGQARFPKTHHRSILHVLAGDQESLDEFDRHQEAIEMSSAAAFIRLGVPVVVTGVATVAVHKFLGWGPLAGAIFLAVVGAVSTLVPIYLTRGFQKWPVVTVKVAEEEEPRPDRLVDREPPRRGRRRPVAAGSSALGVVVLAAAVVLVAGRRGYARGRALRVHPSTSQ